MYEGDWYLIQFMLAEKEKQKVAPISAVGETLCSDSFEMQKLHID